MHSPRTSFGQLFTVLFLNCSSKMYFWTALYFEILCLIMALHRGCHQGNWINALAEDYWSPPPTLHNQPSCVPNIFSEAWYVFVLHAQCTHYLFSCSTQKAVAVSKVYFQHGYANTDIDFDFDFSNVVVHQIWKNQFQIYTRGSPPHCVGVWGGILT